MSVNTGYNRTLHFLQEGGESVMLGSVKKAVFRVLCLGALCLCGGLMAEQS
ncbi:hypothetical protein KVD95_06735 [Helicobacter pylori]|nr:hypothetical protein KVD95_06735 [Helicobacter pylori]